MIHNVLNTDPIFSVPSAAGVPNVNTVPNVPKMSNNGPSVPNPKHWCSVPNVKCTIVHQMYQDSLVIIVFSHQTGWQCSDGDRHNGGVECKRV